MVFKAVYQRQQPGENRMPMNSYNILLRTQHELGIKLQRLADERGVKSRNRMMVVLLDEYCAAWRSRGPAPGAAAAGELDFKVLLRVPNRLAEELNRISATEEVSLNDVINHGLRSGVGARSRRSTPSTRRSSTASHLVLSTSFHGSNDVEHLSLDVLQEPLTKATEVQIAAAYYDIQFLKELFSARPRGPLKVRLVFNGFAGSRLNNQRDELSQLQAVLRRKFQDVEIRLAFARGVFHSKVFLFKSSRRTIGFIGSANATTAALLLNEEILLRLEDGSGSLGQYFERVWQEPSTKSVSTKERYEPRSLIGFFRTGLLYAKRTETMAATFNPFGELLRELTQADKEQLVRVQLPNSEACGVISPFSFRRSMDAHYGTNAVDQNDKDNRKARASVLPYSIETSLGYWVPTAYQAELDANLERSGDKKRQRIERFAKQLRDMGWTKIREGYRRYLQVAETKAFEGVQLAKYLPDLAANPFTDTTRLENRYNTLLSRLDSPEYVSRLCVPYSASTMPEIWEDPIALEDFENSYFEYLHYIAAKQQGRRAASAVQRAAEYPAGADVDEIRDQLLEFLRNTGWSEDTWK